MRRMILLMLTALLVTGVLMGCGGFGVSLATYKSRGMLVYADGLTPPPVDGKAASAPDCDRAQAVELMQRVADDMGIKLKDFSELNDDADSRQVYSNEVVAELATGNIDMCICALQPDEGSYSKTLYFSPAVGVLADGTPVYVVAELGNTEVVSRLSKAAGGE